MDENVEDLVQQWLKDMDPKPEPVKVYIDGVHVGHLTSMSVGPALAREGVYTIGDGANK